MSGNEGHWCHLYRRHTEIKQTHDRTGGRNTVKWINVFLVGGMVNALFVQYSVVYSTTLNQIRINMKML